MHSNSNTTATEMTVDEATRRLTIRAALARYRTILLIAFVLLIALGGWVSYGVYADPGVETTQKSEHTWTATGTFSHGATVTESTAVYDSGTVLENEPRYFTAATPELDGEFVGGYEARTSEDVTVDLTATLVYRATGSDGTVYWSEQERLASTTEDDVAPGELVPATFALNVSEVTARITEIESDLEASPGQTEIVVELEREIDGVIDGEHRSTSDEYTVDVTREENTYGVETPESYDERHEDTRTVTVPTSDGPVRSSGGPLALVLGLGGLVGLRAARNRLPELTPAEREWLAYREDREQYEEVITGLRLPESATDGKRAEVETLASLAAVGIDLGEVIIHDQRTGRYVVREDDIVYVFEPPTLEWVDDGVGGRGHGNDHDTRATGSVNRTPDADLSSLSSDDTPLVVRPDEEGAAANAAGTETATGSLGSRLRSLFGVGGDAEDADSAERTASITLDRNGTNGLETDTTITIDRDDDRESAYDPFEGDSDLGSADGDPLETDQVHEDGIGFEDDAAITPDVEWYETTVLNGDDDSGPATAADDGDESDGSGSNPDSDRNADRDLEPEQIPEIETETRTSDRP